MTESGVFKAIGEDGFARLVHAFYAQIPGDDILGPMYAGRNMEEAEKRLRDFLIFRFGGPPVYIETRGHPRLRMRHAPFAIHEGARDRWLQLMEQAFQQARLNPEAESVLKNFFESTAGFLINRPG